MQFPACGPRPTVAGVEGGANQPENLLERGAFRPVIVEKRAVGIEQEPLVLPHQSLIRVLPGIVKSKPVMDGAVE